MASKYRKTINFKSKELFDKIESISKAMGYSESNFLEGIIQDWYIKNRKKEPQTLIYPVYLDRKTKEINISRKHMIIGTVREINFHKDELSLYRNNKNTRNAFIYDKLKHIISMTLTDLYDADGVDFYTVIITSAKIHIKHNIANNDPYKLSMKIDINTLPIPILYKNKVIPNEIKNLDIRKIKYSKYKNELIRRYKNKKRRYIIAQTEIKEGAYFIEEGVLSDSDIESIAAQQERFNLVMNSQVIEVTFESKYIKSLFL
ncbi:hypothetical protein ACWLKK_05100 [Morganella morganii]|uniref:Uncharacterized protein n=1 Tax=bacterium 19GA11TI05 TaxID=2920688 RepID=A0AAU6TYA4_UNCXX